MNYHYKTILVLLLMSFSSAVKNVTVSKCCKMNETLTRDRQCVPVSPEHADKWKLRIYTGRKFVINKIPLIWNFKENTKPNCLRPLSVMSGTSYSSFFPFLNGSGYAIGFGEEIIHPMHYCLDYEWALICLKESNQPEPISLMIVQKCCPKDSIFSESNSSCIHMKGNEYQIDIESKRLGSGFPSCPQNNMAVAGKLHEGSLQSNGSLLLKDSNVLLPAGDFCLEHILEQAGKSPSILTCKEYLPSHPNVTPISSSENDIRFTIYPIGLGLSAVFLAATLAAGFLLPASHHVLHWRCQTYHVSCLLVGDVLLCITHLWGKMNPVLCILIAVCMHFFFLAAFFWLNTMCFNIWWTFRDLRPQSTEKRQERLRLRLYQAYAWGIPFLIAFLAILLDLIPHDEEYDFLRPKFGKNTCWFYGDMEILTFFFGPIGTLLFINLALFALTARELTCGLWKRELVKSTTERAALGRVCMKLVIVMGVTWTADVLSWAIGGPQELWYLTDFINCLQGVFIFIVIGCQPQVLSAVKRLWCLRKHCQNGTAGTTNHHSSSSQGPPSMGDTLTNTNSLTHNTTKSVPLETSC